MSSSRKQAQRSNHPKTKNTKQNERSTARDGATYQRALALLSDLRRGVGSYSELLRKHRLQGRTARKYLGRDLIGGTRGKRVRASKSDRRLRQLPFRLLTEIFTSKREIRRMRPASPNTSTTAKCSFTASFALTTLWPNGEACELPVGNFSQRQMQSFRWRTMIY